jgi:hypothetical protein
MQNTTEMEVTFNQAGNTIIGSYGEYAKLDKAIAAKNVFVPYGFTVKACDALTFRSLVDHVEVFGHCIKTLAGFRKACQLSGAALLPG